MTGFGVRQVLYMVWNWLRSHGYHLLFGLTLLSLAALITWWSVFIRDAIEQQRQFHYDSIMDSAKIAALSIGHMRTEEPQLGVVPTDNRLEIVRCQNADDPLHVPLAPFWPELCITPTSEYLARIEDKFHRQQLMVVGESSVLVLAVVISCFMLYTVIRLERRSAKELREFWNRITHELKTPITGIKAFLQTLRTQEFSHEELQPLVAMALREVERQEMLAENLLVGQRIARESLGLQLRPVKLVKRVREFFEEHRILLPGNGLELDVDCPEDLEVIADPDALWVIMENLTDNALKYGGAEPQITCRIEASRSQGIIRVCDQGVGFDPAVARKLFQAFKRLSDEQPVGRHGTGMGLYLSRRLAIRMGGNLSAESDGPGKGACFIVTLKRA